MEFQELPAHIQYYLNERCINNDILSALNVKYANDGQYNWIAFPVMDIDGKEKYYKLKASPNAPIEQPKSKTYPSGKAMLYPMPYLLNATRIFLCEGEPDVLVMLSHGLIALSSTHGVNTFPEEWLSEFPKDIEIIVAFDLDDAGRNGERKVMELFRDKRPDITVKCLRLPEHLGNGGDVTDLATYCKGRGQDFVNVLESLIEDAPALVGDPVLHNLGDVEPEEISWLWNNRIPYGKITMLDGDPGLGKSWCSYAIAASVTKGISLPGDNRKLKPSSVLLLTAEDDPADTIRPRIDSVGGDATQVEVLSGCINSDGQERHLSLVDNLGALEKAFSRKKFSLLIIDPLNAYLGGGIDTYNDADIRTVLAPLNKLAAKYRVAVLCIRHLTKTKGGNALYRGQGSIAYIAAARMAHLVAKHPDKSNIRVIACTKVNIAKPPKSMSFEIDDLGVFHWRGEVDIDADALIQASCVNVKDSTLEDAKQFLFDLLWDNPLSAKEVFVQGEDAGFSRRTLERAKKDMKITSKRNGKSWAWQLPKNANESREDAWRSLTENSSDDE